MRSPKTAMGDGPVRPFGDILKQIARETQRAKRALKGRKLAQQVIAEALGDMAARASVRSVKAGVVTIETDSPVLFQELEGFQRERLLAALRQGGINVSILRVNLAKI